MKALFFIEIPTQCHTEELSYQWYKKEPDNETSGYNTLEEIKNNYFNCEVILVLPGFNVTRKQVSSKLTNRKKLELAIAYQLEEALAEEIETLFFAYQPAKEKHSFEVAVINRTWFEKWLEVFNQQQILLSAVITDSMLLETLPEDYLLIQKPDYCLLKIPDLVYSVDNDNISYFLNKLKAILPEELFLISEKSTYQTIIAPNFNLKQIPAQESLLKLLTHDYALSSGFNLLQGSYQPQLKNDWQTIKWVSMVLFGLFFLASSFQGYQHWQLTQQEAKLDQQRSQIFQESFPAIKRIVNPLVQMKNELEKLTQAQQQQGQFISLLAKVAIGLRDLLAQQKIQLLAMELDNNILSIKLNATSLAVIEETNHNLLQQQLKVEMQSPEKVDDKVNVTFKMTGNIE